MKTIVLVLALCSGCLVVPHTTTTARQVGTESLAPEPGPIHSITLAAGTKGGFIAVRAIAERTCTRRVMNLYDVRQEKGADVTDPHDARAKIFGVLVSPVTLPISAIVTGIVLLGSDDVTRVKSLARVDHYACSDAAAHQELVIDLPSGVHAAAKTDDDGRLLFAVPATEPDDGAITVHAGDTERRVEYHRPQPEPAPVARVEPGSVCLAIDATLDAFEDSERANARRTFTEALEAEHQHVVDAGCASTLELWHERRGEDVIVHVHGAGDRVRATAHGSDGLPATYALIAHRLFASVASSEPAPAEHVDAGPATPEQPGTESRSLWYARAGFGSVGAASGLGVAFGYRYRQGSLALDASGTLFHGSGTTAGTIAGELLLFTSPDAPRSWYLGAGLGLGGFSADMAASGSGGEVELTTGYEFETPSRDFRAFFQVDLSKPLYELGADSGSMTAPSTVMISLGVGAGR